MSKLTQLRAVLFGGIVLAACGQGAAQGCFCLEYATPTLEYQLTPGIYYDLSRPGAGYQVDLLPKPIPPFSRFPNYQFFGTVLTHNAVGQPTWYSLQNEWVKGSDAEIVRQQKYGSVTSPFFVSTDGGDFGAPYRPAQTSPHTNLGYVRLVQRGSANIDVEWSGRTTRIRRVALDPNQMAGLWVGVNIRRLVLYQNSHPYTVRIYPRQAAQKIRFWSDEGLPIPSPDAPQFAGECNSSGGLASNLGMICTEGRTDEPSRAITFYFDSADGEFKGIQPCVLPECKDASGAYKPSTADQGPRYFRVLMPHRDLLRIMFVRGTPGNEVILMEERYTRL